MHSRLVPSKLTDSAPLRPNKPQCPGSASAGVGRNSGIMSGSSIGWPSFQKRHVFSSSVKVSQIREVAGGKVRNPLVQIAYSDVVEQLKALAARFALQFGA